MLNAYVIEFIGTFFLVLAIGLTGNPVAIGVMLAVMVYVGGHISGAHYNPAVTVAAWLRGKLAGAQVVPYWMCQVLGAFAAAGLVYALTGKAFGPAPAAEVWKVLTVEFLGTFALALVVLSVATAKKLDGNSFYGFAIGGTVMACAVALGPISGGAFNPAVALGPMIVDALAGGSNLANLWIYLLACLLAGAVAGLSFRFFNPDSKS